MAAYVVGLASFSLALVMTGFAAGAWIVGEDARGFGATALLAGVIGLTLQRGGRPEGEPSRRGALAAVLGLWTAIPVLGAVPYAFSAGLGPLAALFESMSAFTTTGATVIVDFEQVPATIFLYRAFSQWVGGIGILVLFIAVFPSLAIAGRQIFFTESPGPTEERLTPRLRQTASAVTTVYVGLTVACALAYATAGMGIFEAIAHALTTMGAAGFSPNARSFEGYGAAIQAVAIVFMTLAAVNFALLWRAFVGRPRELWRDVELRVYVGLVVVLGALVSVQIWSLYTPGEAVRHGFFQVVSILTTTGYASADFDRWPDGARALLIAAMFVGGSAGSAAGGVKVARWLIMAQHTAREVRRALYPRAVLPLQVGDRQVGEEVVRAVAAFIALYTVVTAVSTLALTALGMDLIAAFTAAATTLGNVGPGLGTVGPMASFADVHPIGQGVLIFNMVAGRLEIVTVFVIVSAGFWRRGRAIR